MLQNVHAIVLLKVAPRVRSATKIDGFDGYQRVIEAVLSCACDGRPQVGDEGIEEIYGCAARF